MTRKRFHGLKKVKVRATWNKYNLYNLTRLKTPPFRAPTFYQQKWYAKSASRAYHGEHIREGQWERMFKPHMSAVVPMDHKRLASSDGSEFATGRGSGKEQYVDSKNGLAQKPVIPYLSMTYAPMERRLDMAVWRALFASSARQARQFCIHGQVKVNGQTMPYAGYLLNPGDMFQVEPDSVMYATGAPKQQAQIKKGKELRYTQSRVNRRLRLPAPKPALLPRPKKIGTVVEVTTSEPASKTSSNMEIFRKERVSTLERMISEAIQLFETGTKKLGAKKKKEMREYIREIRAVRARINRKTQEELDQDIKDLLERFNTIQAIKKTEPITSKAEAQTQKEPKPRKLSEYEQKQLFDAMVRIRDNPEDPTKPYATPWTPRPYMSPFAFVPRYLEVNHRICSAVYLRHPVARPGLAEVPTPFAPETQQLAHNWYLRRR